MNTDINPNSVNELERLALDELAKRLRHDSDIKILDFPCGDGHLSAVLAAQGGHVTACDQGRFCQQVKGRSLAQGKGDVVEFVPCASTDDSALPCGPFDLVVSRHGLHQYTYADARKSLRRLLRTLKIGGKLFVCAYGLHSELGDAYPAANDLIDTRFAELDKPIAERYGISGPVCLYSERNLITLVFEAGGSVLRSFTTTHGTVAAVAVRV